MTLLFVIWFLFGIFHWFDYMWNYNEMPNALDYLLLLPITLMLGPITTLRKIFS